MRTYFLLKYCLFSIFRFYASNSINKTASTQKLPNEGCWWNFAVFNWFKIGQKL